MDHSNMAHDVGHETPDRCGMGPDISHKFDRDLRDIRLRYNAAYAAHRSCVIELDEAAIRQTAPSQQLLEKEAKALRELTEARSKLLTAMTQGRSADPKVF